MSARLACRIADGLTRFNRAPVTVLAFPVVCCVLIAAGWAAGRLELALLALTTVLSIDASWTARLVLLRQGQDAGEVER